MAAFSYELFVHEDDYYIRIICDRMKDDDAPAGFTEMKQSEYHLIKEKWEELNVKKS